MSDTTLPAPTPRNMAPRPTTYNGVKMRSRLEAAWAEQFDACGWSWQYEPECFATEKGQYLPDFRIAIPGAHVDLFVEVKPSVGIDWRKMHAYGDIVKVNTQCPLIVAVGADEHGCVSIRDLSAPRLLMPAYCSICESTTLVTSTDLLCGVHDFVHPVRPVASLYATEWLNYTFARDPFDMWLRGAAEERPDCAVGWIG